MMKEMYKGKVNSPETLLSEQITAAKTDIKVEDASVLPTGPNLAVIGIGVDAETIKYSGINNNILVGCTRGFQGTAKVWDANTPIARNLTEYDIGSIQENVNELDNVKLDADSKLDTNKVDFVEATTRVNILATDNLKTIFGKIKKYFSDLKTVAFTGKASDLSTDDSNLLVTKTEKTTWNNKYDAETKLTVTELNFTGTILALFKNIGTKMTEMTLRLIPTGGATGQVLKKTSDGFGWGTDENTTYSAGTNISISGGSISATDTTYGIATTSANGLMSSADKTKLNGLLNTVFLTESAYTALGTKDPNTQYLTY